MPQISNFRIPKTKKKQTKNEIKSQAHSLTHIHKTVIKDMGIFCSFIDFYRYNKKERFLSMTPHLHTNQQGSKQENLNDMPAIKRNMKE